MRFLLSTSLFLSAPLGLPALGALGEADVRPVLERYCFKCHSEKRVKAGVSFQSFGGSLDVWRDRSTWIRVRDAVAGGHMPPEDATRELPDAERSALLRWVDHTLDNVDVSRLPEDPGHIPPRRLNRTEYRYTVEDLFGIETRSYAALPEDQAPEGGFDNEAATLSVQPLLVERYLQAADVAVEEVWGDDDALRRLVFVSPPVRRVVADGIMPYVSDEAVGGGLEMGDGSFTVAVRFRTTAGGALFSKAPEGDSWVPDAKVLFVSDSGRVAYDIGWLGEVHTRRGYDDGRWHVAVLHQAGGVVSIYVDGKLEVREEMATPDVAGHRFKVGAAGDEFVPFAGEISKVEFYNKGLGAQEIRAAARGRAVGPRPDFVWGFPPTVAARQDPPFDEAAAARRVIKTFLTNAFRRAVTDAELARYHALFQQARSLGDDYHTAMKLPVRTALVSPAFVFRAEGDQGARAAHRVTPLELASRLSYFLWASKPDMRLMKLGATGKLADREVLEAEIARMLADPRSRRMSARFANQWLRIDGLGETVGPDRELFPHAGPELLAAMKEESVWFVHSIFAEDRSVLTLLDADYTYLDGRLARHYGIRGITGDRMEKVRLSGNHRGGILTQASVLTASSSPRRTSPVFRGKWILDVVLGQPPPPPPPDVPSLDEPGGGDPVDLRSSLERHRADAACAGCHRRIDPLGFALEAFDATGRLRPGPVDNRGALPDGTAVEGHVGLKRVLREEMAQEFVRHFTSQLLCYALGRELVFTDEGPLQTILSRVRDAGYSSQVLIREIVNSYPFQYRRGPDGENTPMGGQRP